METAPTPESKTYKYTYKDSFDNQKIIFITEAHTIEEADKKLQEQTGIDPTKKPNIGCSIEEL